VHSDQIDIDVAKAQGLINDQFPQFGGQKVTPLKTTGTVNAIFRIGELHTARFPLQAVEREVIEAEAAAIAEFHAHCPFPSPEPVGIGRPGRGYPLAWSVQSWIDGHVATPSGVASSADFALDLARLVAALRAVGTDGRVFDGRGRGGDLRDHDAWMEECLARSKGLLDVARLRRMWAEFRELPSAQREMMSHKDLIPGNLLVKDGRLAGVLDTGGFGPADAALDLVAGWHMLDQERRRLFRDTLEVAEPEWQRGAAWAFQQAMGLVWYYADSNAVMSTLGRSTLARLVEDADGA
jgi:aminoglycoside phosphotransferase (APT) family kinase protein